MLSQKSEIQETFRAECKSRYIPELKTPPACAIAFCTPPSVHFLIAPSELLQPLPQLFSSDEFLRGVPIAVLAHDNALCEAIAAPGELIMGEPRAGIVLSCASAGEQRSDETSATDGVCKALRNVCNT